MSWRPAQSLVVLRDQLNADYPGWLFLGFLGDQAHASVPSDHNPNAAGVVCALDIGPGGGLAIHALADRLLAVRHPDLKYLISNRRIAGDWTGWKWAPYYGSDPHDTHIHVSVGRGDDGKSTPPYDDTNLWNVKGEPMINEADVRFLFDKALGIAPTAADIAWGVGKTWPVFMDAIYKRPEALIQHSDVDNIWKKFIPTPIKPEDYAYAQGMNPRRYFYAVMARPDCVSVASLQQEYVPVTDQLFKKK